MRPGEIKIEQLGKRYWIGVGSGGRDDDEMLDDAETDPDHETGESGVLSFFGRRRELWALRQINCHISPGERVGIVGANGSGKSTLIRILSRVLPPSEGSVEGGGVVVPFAALRSPLSPQLSGCDNLRMLARLLEIPLERLEERLPQIIEFSELGVLAHEKVSRYSDGSYVRLSSAMGLFIDADVFLIDDSLKVGDEVFRAKFDTKFAELLRSRVTLVYASNTLSFLRLYCQRALWLDNGRLVADGPVNTVIQRFLSKNDEFVELEDLTRADNEPSAGAGDQAEAVGAAASDTAAAAPVNTISIPAERLRLVQEWVEQSTQAEQLWEKVLKRWREKPHPHDAMNIGSVHIHDTCTLGVIHTLRCLNSEGRSIRRCLPGERLVLELLVETFEPDVTVSVRFELDSFTSLAWVTEPLLPLAAAERGQYLFRAELDGSFSSHNFENVSLKFRFRILLEKPSTHQREMISSTVRIDLRGDVRAGFDEQRRAAGAPATSIIQPTPAYLEAPEQIPGFDPAADADPDTLARTRWQNVNRRPALRPGIKWMVYRVVDPSPPQPEAAAEPAALEPANS